MGTIHVKSLLKRLGYEIGQNFMVAMAKAPVQTAQAEATFEILGGYGWRAAPVYAGDKTDQPFPASASEPAYIPITQVPWITFDFKRYDDLNELDFKKYKYISILPGYRPFPFLESSNKVFMYKNLDGSNLLLETNDENHTIRLPPEEYYHTVPNQWSFNAGVFPYMFGVEDDKTFIRYPEMPYLGASAMANSQNTFWHGNSIFPDSISNASYETTDDPPELVPGPYKFNEYVPPFVISEEKNVYSIDGYTRKSLEELEFVGDEEYKDKIYKIEKTDKQAPIVRMYNDENKIKELNSISVVEQTFTIPEKSYQLVNRQAWYEHFSVSGYWNLSGGSMLGNGWHYPVNDIVQRDDGSIYTAGWAMYADFEPYYRGPILNRWSVDGLIHYNILGLGFDPEPPEGEIRLVPPLSEEIPHINDYPGGVATGNDATAWKEFYETIDDYVFQESLNQAEEWKKLSPRWIGWLMGRIPPPDGSMTNNRVRKVWEPIDSGPPDDKKANWQNLADLPAMAQKLKNNSLLVKILDLTYERVENRWQLTSDKITLEDIASLHIDTSNMEDSDGNLINLQTNWKEILKWIVFEELATPEQKALDQELRSVGRRVDTFDGQPFVHKIEQWLRGCSAIVAVNEIPDDEPLPFSPFEIAQESNSIAYPYMSARPYISGFRKKDLDIFLDDVIQNSNPTWHGWIQGEVRERGATSDTPETSFIIEQAAPWYYDSVIDSPNGIGSVSNVYGDETNSLKIPVSYYIKNNAIPNTGEVLEEEHLYEGDSEKESYFALLGSNSKELCRVYFNAAIEADKLIDEEEDDDGEILKWSKMTKTFSYNSFDPMKNVIFKADGEMFTEDTVCITPLAIEEFLLNNIIYKGKYGQLASPLSREPTNLNGISVSSYWISADVTEDEKYLTTVVIYKPDDNSPDVLVEVELAILDPDKPEVDAVDRILETIKWSGTLEEFLGEKIYEMISFLDFVPMQDYRFLSNKWPTPSGTIKMADRQSLYAYVRASTESEEEIADDSRVVELEGPEVEPEEEEKLIKPLNLELTVFDRYYYIHFRPKGSGESKFISPIECPVVPTVIASNLEEFDPNITPKNQIENYLAVENPKKLSIHPSFEIEEDMICVIESEKSSSNDIIEYDYQTSLEKIMYHIDSPKNYRFEGSVKGIKRNDIVTFYFADKEIHAQFGLYLNIDYIYIWTKNADPFYTVYDEYGTFEYLYATAVKSDKHLQFYKRKDPSRVDFNYNEGNQSILIDFSGPSGNHPNNNVIYSILPVLGIYTSNDGANRT